MKTRNEKLWDIFDFVNNRLEVDHVELTGLDMKLEVYWVSKLDKKFAVRRVLEDRKPFLTEEEIDKVWIYINMLKEKL